MHVIIDGTPHDVKENLLVVHEVILQNGKPGELYLSITTDRMVADLFDTTGHLGTDEGRMGDLVSLLENKA